MKLGDISLDDLALSYMQSVFPWQEFDRKKDLDRKIAEFQKSVNKAKAVQDKAKGFAVSEESDMCEEEIQDFAKKFTEMIGR